MERKNIWLPAIFSIAVLAATAYLSVADFLTGQPSLLAQVGGGSSLAANQAFIRNSNSFALSNDLVSIPISFPIGQHTAADLVNVKVGGLETQVTPTSFYKNGTVKTAVARVLASVPANTEQVLTIGTGSNATSFTPPTEVQALLNEGIKVVSKDLGGGTYETVFSPTSAAIVENGPVVKTYQFTKKHRPVAGCATSLASNCLPYLFTSTLWVSVVKDKPYVKVTHFVTNFGNLAEDSWTAGDPYNYAEGQNGFVFYDSIYFETNTGSTPSYLHVLDSSRIAPSVKQIIAPEVNRFMVMPTNGQQTLSGSFGEGPSLGSVPSQSNFIGAGQGFLTYAVLHVGVASAPQFTDPFEEPNISAGQALARYNQIDGYFFEDIVRPDAISPNFSFSNDAAAWYGSVLSGLDGHRFGKYDYSQKNMGNTGWHEHYRQEPIPVVHYLMSCHGRCEERYLDALRYHLYGAASVVNHAPGFHPQAHPETNLAGYQAPIFETDTGGGLHCPVVWGAKDRLGFCNHDINASDAFRKDAAGNHYTAYANWTARGLWHNWTTRDSLHASVGMEYYRWMFTADHAAKFLGQNQVNGFASEFYHEYLTLCNVSVPGSCPHTVTRAKGRALLNIVKTFSVTNDPWYRSMAELLVNTIDIEKDHASPGGNGVNPKTGEAYPVRYYTDDFRSKTPCPITQQNSCHAQFREETQVLAGLAAAYWDAITNSSYLTKIRTLLDDGLYFAFTFAVRRADEVLNGKPDLLGTGNIVMGTGGRDDYVTTGYTGVASEAIVPYYEFSTDHQVYQGLCNGVKLGKELGLNVEYESDFLYLFDNVWLKMWKLFPFQGTWGVQLNNEFSDNVLCGLRLKGLPTALESNPYSDSDNDGYTAAVNDCNDGNASIHPGKQTSGNEICTDGIDNNCNGLIDCADSLCFGNGACTATAFCGNNQINPPETCDITTSTAAGEHHNGTMSGFNTCADFTCIASGLVGGCMCGSGGSTPPPPPACNPACGSSQECVNGVCVDEPPPSSPTVTLSVPDALASESAGNTGTFRVARTGSTAGALAVSFTVSGTAISGSDFNALGTAKTIPSGAASADVTVTPINDLLVEAAETVTMALASGTGYTVGVPSSGTVTILDNDSLGLPLTLSPYCNGSSSEVSIAWTDAGLGSQGYNAVIDTDNNINNGFYFKLVPSGTTTVNGPAGFTPYVFVNSLVLSGGADYSVTLYYNLDGTSVTKSFTALTCGGTTPPTTPPTSPPTAPPNSPPTSPPTAPPTTPPPAPAPPPGTVSPSLVAPTLLTGIVKTPTTLVLFWSPGFTGLGQRLERSYDGVNFTEIQVLPPYYYYWNVVDALPGTAHYYRIRSYDATGYSAYSNIASVVTPGGEVVTAPTDTMFIKNLYKGFTDPEVGALQTCLATDPALYPEGIVSGYFGSLTEGAVQRFQAKYGIVSSGTPAATGYGYVGPKTREQLNQVCTGVTVIPPPTGVPPVTPPSGGLAFTQPLGIGSSGTQVTLLQQFLSQNSALYPEGIVSGYFGSLTEGAVQRFQAKYGIVSSGTPATTGYGYVGSKTREKLNELYGGLP